MKIKTQNEASDVSHIGDTLRRTLLRLRGEKKWLALAIFFSAVTVAASLLIPIVIGNAIDAMIGRENVDLAFIAKMLVLIGIIAIIGAVAQWLLSLCANRLAYRAVHDVRKEAFAHLQTLPLSYLDAHPIGDVVNRVVSDADTYADGLLIGFTQLFTGVVTIIGTLILMLTIEPIIALIVVCVTPLSLFASRFIATRTHSMFKAQSTIRGEQTALINEVVGNEKTVKAFGREKEMLRRFDGISEQLRKASLRATFFSSLTNPVTRFVNSVVYAAVALSGALLAIPGSITVGALASVLSYANQYTKPFNEIAGVITELQNAFVSAERLFRLCDAAPEPPLPAGAAVLSEVDGAVSLENVCFSYVPERPLIRDVSLAVRPGQKIAIVGPTGCGKTTLINLLMRFYDVGSGRITVDDEDIRGVTRESLRAAYGMVLQETFLKSGTIRDNIAFGKPDATDGEIVAAAKAAHADGFIRRLPKQYDTEIGDNGGSLSEGQKQLLCIARVMLVLPPMLILDEATSSIDTRTEIRIQKAFSTLMRGRTSFIVAHRLSTILDADCILVMRDGNVVEQGKHEELLARNGFYASLFHSQFARDEDKSEA